MTAERHWFIFFWLSTTCIPIMISGILCWTVLLMFFMGSMRIMGNVTVSFPGDMTSRQIILSYHSWECCQKVWQTVWITVALIGAESSSLSISQHHNNWHLVSLFASMLPCIPDASKIFISLCYKLPTFGLPAQWRLTNFSQKRAGTISSRYLMFICLKHQR